MRLIGAHLSIAGGVHLAVLEAEKLGCSAIQIFSKSSNQWKALPLSPEEISLFHSCRDRTGVAVPMVHSAYLINLASPDPVLYQRSVEAMIDEGERCRLLGIPHLVFHPGSHVESGVEEGIERIAKGMNAVLERTSSVKLVLESTAGQGTAIGSRFEELAMILEQVKKKERTGICLDTCHLFASGYDIRRPEGYEKTIAELDRIIGREKIVGFHLNDSKKGLGSRVDRHEHIGKGEIGLDLFRLLLHDQRFVHLPLILETPKGEWKRSGSPERESFHSSPFDVMNLKTLRDLLDREAGGP